MISKSIIILMIVGLVLIITGVFLVMQGTLPPTPTSEKEIKACKVLIVYAKELSSKEQEALIDVVKAITNYLGGIKGGIKCGIHEFISNETLKIKLPAYPAIVLSTEYIPPKAKDVFTRITGNYWLLKPPYLYYLARTAGKALNMTFTYSSRAILVNGKLPIAGTTSVEGIKEALKELLTWTSATNVTDILTASYSKYPNLPYYPTVVLVPELHINLSSLSPIVVSVGGNRYVYEPLWFNSNLLPYLSNVSLGNVVIEIHKEPYGEGPTIGKGNPPLRIVVYEDMNCPYCARLFSNTIPLVILKYVEKGKALITFKLITVHEESREIHEVLTCYHMVKGNSTGYYRTLLKLYRLVIEGKSPSLDDFKKFTGIDPKTLTKDCNASLILNKDLEEARSYGIIGTPAMVLWNKDLGLGLLIIGYVDFDTLEGLISYVT